LFFHHFSRELRETKPRMARIARVQTERWCNTLRGWEFFATMTRNFADSNSTSVKVQPLRWGRIVTGALLLELVLIIVLVPPLQILGPEKVVPFVYAACLVLAFGVTRWILRRVSHRPIVHGALIGIVATVLYILMCLANPDGIRSVIAMYGVFGFTVGNALRIVGCVAAGYALQGRIGESTPEFQNSTKARH
jgi:hypothetical protein